MKNRVKGFIIMIAVGLVLSAFWQSSIAIDWRNDVSSNMNAYCVYAKACEYFDNSEEKVTGVFTGEISEGDPFGRYFCCERLELYGYGYYYLMVKDSDVVQCYWQYKNSLDERADELTAALEKGKPLSYINAGGDHIGGFPEVIRECRPPLKIIYDELPYVALMFEPLLVLIAVYVLALLIRPFAVRLLRRFGESRQ